MTEKNIILASASPRRLELMRKHNIEPTVLPSNTEEILPDKISMTDAVEMLAAQKAEACYESLTDDYSNSLIIAADTIVYKDEIMGKPEDREDAFRMLSKIRNTFHYVVTGVCIIDVDTGKRDVFSDVTKVFCKDYSDEDIWDYINGEEPMDKAGSYAIQGLFGKHIDHIEGDYENVIGLPFYRIEPFLK